MELVFWDVFWCVLGMFGKGGIDGLGVLDVDLETRRFSSYD